MHVPVYIISVTLSSAHSGGISFQQSNTVIEHTPTSSIFAIDWHKLGHKRNKPRGVVFLSKSFLTLSFTFSRTLDDPAGRWASGSRPLVTAP